MTGRVIPRPGRKQLASMVVAIAFVIWTAWRHFDLYLLSYLLLFLWPIYLQRRPPTVVTAGGISRPWRKPKHLDWSQVVAVRAGTAWSSTVRVVLADGQEVALEDIPVDRTAEVAALGDKPVQAAGRPPVQPPPRPRSATEIEIDVKRQAAALAAQRQLLAEQSDRLHWKP